MGLQARDALPEILLGGEAGNLQPRDHIGGDGVGVLELLVEVTGEQQNGVFQFALAVDQRAFAEFAGHHDGAEENRRHQQAAAQRQPQHRPPDRGGKMPSDGRGSGLQVLHVVKQIEHFPFSPGTCIRCRHGISG